MDCNIKLLLGFHTFCTPVSITLTARCEQLLYLLPFPSLFLSATNIRKKSRYMVLPITNPIIGATLHSCLCTTQALESRAGNPPKAVPVTGRRSYGKGCGI